MPNILVLKRPEDHVYDEISVSEDKLGETVEDLYQKLDNKYSIEIRYD